jgi:rhamnosyltransferase
VETEQPVKVAVLLATYNGVGYIADQIASLKQNVTPFTLHWLDDHSNDNTREVVRRTTESLGFDIREWHQSQHVGVPAVFFQLMECVEAEIYLFCDQDDIWQPGKIDAAVRSLCPDRMFPVLCFLDVLVFKDGEPLKTQHLFDLIGADIGATMRESSAFIFNRVIGNTVGFTKPLRDIVISHKDIALGHAAMHDWWMYLIAIASGSARILLNAPTTLYRLHGGNTSGVYFGLFRGMEFKRWRQMWRLHQSIRTWAARQASGFCLAARGLPVGPRLERLLPVARLVATLDRRQSVGEIIRLIRCGAMPPYRSWSFWLVVACLCSDAGSI